MEEIKGFTGWAIIDLFGHQKIAGLCSEQPVAGVSMLRVDVPAVNGKQAFSKLFGHGAIYSIAPTDEKTVLAVIPIIDYVPIEPWILPSDQQSLQIGHFQSFGPFERDDDEEWH